MVPPPPSPPSGRDDDIAWDELRASLDELLERRIRQNQEELLDPWRKLVAGSESAQAEIDRTVQSLQIFFRKWVVEIMFVLAQHNAMRFNELKRGLEGISGRTLSKRLGELGEQGLVDRTVFDETPVRVEYALTEKGEDVANLALPMIVYLRMRGIGAAGQP